MAAPRPATGLLVATGQGAFSPSTRPRRRDPGGTLSTLGSTSALLPPPNRAPMRFCGRPRALQDQHASARRAWNTHLMSAGDCLDGYATGATLTAAGLHSPVTCLTAACSCVQHGSFLCSYLSWVSSWPARCRHRRSPRVCWAVFAVWAVAPSAPRNPRRCCCYY